MFEQLFNSPLIYSLALTLVHFLWQGLLVALILKSLLFIIDKNKPKLRYALATLAMTSNAALALLTFAIIYADANSILNNNISPIPLTSLVHELTQQNTLFSYQELISSILAYALPYLAFSWLTLVSILASKLLIEVRNVNNLPMHSCVSPSGSLLSRFELLAKQINLAKTPRLLISLKAEVPMAIGWLKPVVLLPASMVTGLDSAQLEMLILHELAHIRRHDYLVNFLQTLIELLFFFHPCVHWIGKQMRNEREYCSDDIAVQHCGDAIAYAHTLTDTASLCAQGHFHTIPTMAMAASGGDLKARILRLVDHHCAPNNHTSKSLAAISLLFGLTIISINQIVTTPFVQPLSSTSPWQDNKDQDRDTIKYNLNAIGFDKGKISNSSAALTKNSIAQHLLTRDETLTDKSPLVISEQQNKIALTTVIIEPSVTFSLAVENEFNFESSPLKTIELNGALANNTSKTTKAIKTSFAPIQLKTPQPAESENPLYSAIYTKKSNVSKSTGFAITENDIAKNASTISKYISTVDQQLIKPLPVFNRAPKITSLIQEKELRALAANIDVFEQQGESLPDTLNLDSINKVKQNTRLTYAEEIKALGIQNDLYAASLPLNPSAQDITKAKQSSLAKQNYSKPIKFNKPQLLNSISPIYPSIAKRRGIEMEVKVNFTIDRNGKVKDIQFGQHNKLSYFKSAVKSAIRKWRFTPATENNTTIESKMSKIFSFSLHT